MLRRGWFQASVRAPRAPAAVAPGRRVSKRSQPRAAGPVFPPGAFQERCLFQLQEFGKDPFHPFLEVAAEAGAGQNGPHVKGIDFHIPKFAGNLSRGDKLRKTFGDRGFSDAGLSDVHRVVLETAAEDLDGPGEDLVPADERIQIAGLRPGGQFRCIRAEKFVRLRLVPADGFPPPDSGIRFPAPLLFRQDRDPVGDVVEEDQAADPLPLQEKGGVRLLFFEQRNQDIPQIQRFLLGGGAMPGRPFENALKSEGLNRPARRRCRRVGHVEVFFQNPFQPRGIAAAMEDDLFPLVKKKGGVEEMFGRDEFMPANVCLGIRRHDNPVEIFTDLHVRSSCNR